MVLHGFAQGSECTWRILNKVVEEVKAEAAFEQNLYYLKRESEREREREREREGERERGGERGREREREGERGREREREGEVGIIFPFPLDCAQPCRQLLGSRASRGLCFCWNT